MVSGTITILIAVGTQAHVEKLAAGHTSDAQDFMDTLVDNLVNQAIRVWPFHWKDLDHTTLGITHLAEIRTAFARPLLPISHPAFTIHRSPFPFIPSRSHSHHSLPIAYASRRERQGSLAVAEQMATELPEQAVAARMHVTKARIQADAAESAQRKAESSALGIGLLSEPSEFTAAAIAARNEEATKAAAQEAAKRVEDTLAAATEVAKIHAATMVARKEISASLKKHIGRGEGGPQAVRVEKKAKKAEEAERRIERSADEAVIHSERARAAEQRAQEAAVRATAARLEVENTAATAA